MPDMEQRVAAVEARSDEQYRSFDRLVGLFERTLEKHAELNIQLAEIGATLKNPSVEHCAQRIVIKEIEASLVEEGRQRQRNEEKLSARLTSLETFATQIQTGMAIAKVMIFGGGFLSLVAIIGLIAMLFKAK